MNKPKTDFTIGADPEFTCIGAQRIIAAGTILNPVHRDDGESEHDRSGVFGSHEFGQDGSCGPLELRPKPSENPLQVVENLRGILIDAADTNRDFLKYRWMAGSYQVSYPLGGHMHFGIKAGSDTLRGYVTVLDSYMGSILTLIEGKEGSMRRASGYGMPGGYRGQHWGFEYRTPGSWLTSPYVAAACLCLGKTIMSEVMNNSKFEPKPYAKESPVIRNCDYPSAGLIANGDIKTLRSRFKDIWGEITQMDLYQEYKPYLDVLYFLVTNNLTWQSSVGMKAAWGIENFSVPLPRSIPMDTIWHPYRQEACHG